ncbi:MAG TPA: glycosyltransferase family 1 protein, partial [Phototrophicaceae bacterium]|nr:glycosyltransferase family 1 protein [Phototrophicaceae bacterium]
AAARGSAHVITLSEAAKTGIIKHIGLPPESVTPIHLGVDEVFHPRLGAEKDEAVRQKYNLPTDDFILYLGSYHRHKNVNELLLAYTYVTQGLGERYPLVLAGREPVWGSSPVFPDLRKYAKELEITDMLQWTGYVDEADKPSFYRLAKVFVFPSLYEGFGLPVIEAMASGTPTIAKDIPVMQEIVGDGAFLVKNERKMGGSIIALIEQEPFRKSLINQGLAQATRYQWRKTARETLQIYDIVMRR